MTDAQRRKLMTSRPEILAKRITPTLLLLALGGALLVTTPRTAGASPCKPDGQACRTNQSCCGTNGHNGLCVDRKSTRLNSSHDQISYAVFCLKKKKKF